MERVLIQYSPKNVHPQVLGKDEGGTITCRFPRLLVDRARSTRNELMVVLSIQNPDLDGSHGFFFGVGLSPTVLLRACEFDLVSFAVPPRLRNEGPGEILVDALETALNATGTLRFWLQTDSMMIAGELRVGDAIRTIAINRVFLESHFERIS